MGYFRAVVVVGGAAAFLFFGVGKIRARNRGQARQAPRYRSRSYMVTGVWGIMSAEQPCSRRHPPTDLAVLPHVICRAPSRFSEECPNFRTSRLTAAPFSHQHPPRQTIHTQFRQDGEYTSEFAISTFPGPGCDDDYMFGSGARSKRGTTGTTERAGTTTTRLAMTHDRIKY